LLLQQFVIDAGVFVPHEKTVFLVDALDFFALNLIEGRGALIIIGCKGFILEFPIFNVDQLAQMEDIVYTLNHVSNYFLQVLDLDVAIQHQEGVWKSYVNLG
jgi:hypothetical protein